MDLVLTLVSFFPKDPAGIFSTPYPVDDVLPTKFRRERPHLAFQCTTFRAKKLVCGHWHTGLPVRDIIENGEIRIMKIGDVPVGERYIWGWRVYRRHDAAIEYGREIENDEPGIQPHPSHVTPTAETEKAAVRIQEPHPSIDAKRAGARSPRLEAEKLARDVERFEETFDDWLEQEIERLETVGEPERMRNTIAPARQDKMMGAHEQDLILVGKTDQSFENENLGYND